MTPGLTFFWRFIFYHRCTFQPQLFFHTFRITMSQRVASSEAAGNQDDNVMHRINQLAKLVEQGLLKKSELTGMIKAIYLGTAGAGSPSPPKDSPARRARRYRRPASPETVKVRRIIEDPIERRFQLQCVTVASQRNSVYDSGGCSYMSIIYQHHIWLPYMIIYGIFL